MVSIKFAFFFLLSNLAIILWIAIFKQNYINSLCNQNIIKMILNQIVENKKLEIEAAKKKLPLNRLRGMLKISDRNFKDAIERNLSLIAEIKRASPSKGIIIKNPDIKKIAGIYDNYADAISVVTDRKFFSGNADDINKIKRYTCKPVLRKDFIIDEYQIYESRYYCADAVLLIASLLDEKQIKRFIKISKRYNMDCVVEVHDKSELKKALLAGAEIIGINNRNLNDFNVDINTTLKLTRYIPKGKIIISESGFKSGKDIEKIKKVANAVLIGTSLLKSRNIADKIKEFSRTKIKICGITNEKDAINAERLGADFIGFIFYKKSPRHIDENTAKKIIGKLKKSKAVGVFVNEEFSEIKRISDYCGLDYIQMHGDEIPVLCSKLKDATGKKIIKAIRIKNKRDIEKLKKYYVDYFLFDSYSDMLFGGTGKRFNWKILKGLKNDYFLSGGLNQLNVKRAVKLKPYAVDTASGVESSAGKKDLKKMKLFIESII